MGTIASQQLSEDESDTKPKKYNKVRFTHHFWRDIASGASYASYTSKTLTIGFGISLFQTLDSARLQRHQSALGILYRRQLTALQ